MAMSSMSPYSRARRWARAWRDTKWFRLRSDVRLAVALSIGTGIGAYVLNHSERSFRMNDITFPAIYGLLALVGWLAVSNGVEFAWKFAVAGYKNEIDDSRTARPAVTTPLVHFEAPFRIEDPAKSGKSVLCRVAIHYDGNEDGIQTEAHFAPFVAGRELVRPAMHTLRRAVPTPWMAVDPVTLRNGQTAYIDLVGFENKGEANQKCYAVDVIKFSKGELFRESVVLPANEYVVKLRVLYSNQAYDEQTYNVRVNGGDEPLTFGEAEETQS